MCAKYKFGIFVCPGGCWAQTETDLELPMQLKDLDFPAKVLMRVIFQIQQIVDSALNIVSLKDCF